MSYDITLPKSQEMISLVKMPFSFKVIVLMVSYALFTISYLRAVFFSFSEVDAIHAAPLCYWNRKGIKKRILYAAH